MHEGELYEFRNRSTWEVLGSATLVSAQPAASDNTQARSVAIKDFILLSPIVIFDHPLLAHVAFLSDSDVRLRNIITVCH